MSNISRDIVWSIIRDTSSYRHRQRGVQKTFCRDPLNMKNVHAFRYSGLVNDRAQQVSSVTDAKGKKSLQLTYKTKTYKRHPNKNTKTVSLGGHGRRVLKNVTKFTSAYRSDLKKLAARRASQLIRANAPLTTKQVRKAKLAARK